MKIIKIKIEVNKGSSFPITSLNYDPKKLIKEELVWKSATPDIVEFNDRSNVIRALRVGCGTIYAEDQNGVIRVFCTVNVKNVEMTVNAMSRVVSNPGVEADMLMYSNAYGYNNTDTITSMGYTGKIFSYTQTGSQVTLESGYLIKTGIQNLDSSLFRSELVYMNNIYSSLTPEQREAWLTLRAKAFFNQVKMLITGGITKKVLSIAKEILLNAGIDLGSAFEAAVNGFYDWYLAEQNAESYFDDFK